MGFKQKIKGFVSCLEVNPPIDSIAGVRKILKLDIDTISVTDNSLSVMRMSALAYSKLLLEQGIDPILHVTCRDRNRISLQSELLGAHALGIRNILALSGDSIEVGDHPSAKPVFDLDSVQLIRIIKNLNKGKTLNGKKITPTDFFIGAAINPNTDFIEGQILKMKKKDADFYITQPIFEIDKFKNFLKLTKFNSKPIIAGIIPLRSREHVQFLNGVPGINIPEKIIQQLKNPKEGIALAKDLIKQLKPLCNGIHLMNVKEYNIIKQLSI